MTADTYHVAIVDDHESVRMGLHVALENAGLEVVAAAPTVDGVLEITAAGAFQVAILDLLLNDRRSVTENVTRLRERDCGVLIHSIADRVALVREAFAAGAAGLVPKSADTSTVVSAVRTVAEGGELTNLEWASAIEADRDFAQAQLGRREREILHLYASGLPLKMVAFQLGISYSTAREYLQRIRQKYTQVGRPAPTKVDLLRRAIEDGILPPTQA